MAIFFFQMYCNLCDIVYATALDWMKHKVHHGSLSCDFCKKDFANKGRIKRDISDVHEGRKNFECEVCGQAFSQKANKDACIT